MCYAFNYRSGSANCHCSLPFQHVIGDKSELECICTYFSILQWIIPKNMDAKANFEQKNI